MTTQPDNQTGRKTEKEIQDSIAKKIHCVGSSNYRDFEHLKKLNASRAVDIELQALKLFHAQEMAFMQGEIDRANYTIEVLQKEHSTECNCDYMTFGEHSTRCPQFKEQR